ncbi:hypothetical protein C8R45DRAFT_1021775 [Mycena sanguinolenta]|nr:hypothetical protein C8R45DRAFT_1021775 [Mycena sanguinolenta]
MAAQRNPPEYTYQTRSRSNASPAVGARTGTPDKGVRPAHRRSLITGTDAHRPSNVPPSSPDISAPSTHSNTRRPHRNRRPGKPVADAPNFPEDGSQHKRTHMDADSDRPSKRARKAAPPPEDGPAIGIQESSANVGSSRQQTSTNAAAGSRSRASSARPESSNSQGDRSTDESMEFPHVSVNGGNGGSGRGRGGNGGNATGPVVIYAKTVHYYNQHS